MMLQTIKFDKILANFPDKKISHACVNVSKECFSSAASHPPLTTDKERSVWHAVSGEGTMIIILGIICSKTGFAGASSLPSLSSLVNRSLWPNASHNYHSLTEVCRTADRRT